MKKLLPVFFFLFFLTYVSVAQQSVVSGIVIDATSKEALIGATVSLEGHGVITDFEGRYSLELENGDYVLTFSYVGYNSKEIPIDLKGDTRLDVELGSNLVLNEVVVTADIAIERETPVAFSNIPTQKLDEELAAQDIPMILNSTPGAYATQSGGGDGDARITIRGFNQRNVAVMLDGIPVNDMENGWVYWSNWFGLDLVTQTMQVQRGLGASKLSVPSVGGTINILTKGIDARKGLKFKQEVGNDGFLRSTFGATTGRLKNGWAASVAGSYKQGDGWVDGNFTKGYFYYLRIDKQIGNHLLSVQGFGAPQEHGQRPFTAPLAQVDGDYAMKNGVPQAVIDEIIDDNIIYDKGRRYNSHWGYLNGKLVNSRKNFYHKPQFSLRHSWQASSRLYVSNVAYLSLGNGGGTADEGADIPLDENDQLDFDKAVESNQPTVFNPNGLSNTILRAGRNNHFWYGLLSTLQYSFSKRLVLSGGIDGRYYEGEHYREVYDLLGGTGWTNNNLQEGDRYDYDYTGFVRQIGAFALLEYKGDNWATFINGSASTSGNKYKNNFSGLEIDWVNKPSLTVKAGATYNIDDQNGVFFNIGRLDKAQRYSNIIITNFWTDAADGTVADNYENEKINAIELGYNFKSSIFSANLNTYYTQWQNKPLDQLPTVPLDPEDPDSDRIPVNINGIAALHKGIELDFAFRPIEELTIEGLASIGDWIWNSKDTARLILSNDVTYEYEFDAKGVHVGDAAQLQFGGLIRYEPIKNFYLKLNGTHFAKNYADFQPETLQDENGGRDSWQLPNYTVFSFHTGYYFRVKEIGVNIRANVLNLFDKVHVTDARNNDSFNSPAFNDFDAKSASVHYGQGRRWTMSLQLSF